MKKNILLFSLIIGIVLSGCSVLEPPNPNLYTGSVEGNEFTITSEVSSKILKRTVEEGEMVTKGDPLFLLDSEALLLEKEQLELKKEIAELTYQDLKNGINQESLNAANKKIATVNREIASHRNDLAYYKKEHEKTKALYESGAVSKNKFDQSLHAVEKIQNKINVLYSKKSEALSNYKKLKTTFSDETLIKAEKEIKLLEKSIAKIDKSLEKYKIISPITGTIQNLNYDTNEVIHAFTNAGKIIGRKKLFINIYIPEKYLSKINIGKKVHFTDKFLSNDTYGEIVFISNKAEFTPKNVESKESKQEMVFKVKIKIHTVKNIMPGMFLTVNIEGDDND